VHVFISWSKEPSRTVAEALRDWLPDVIQSLKPWMSSTDIGAGARWGAEVADALAGCRIGILCVTSSNQREPWLLFEAGALAKTLRETFVCPYLIQMKAADLAPGPLNQFQAKTADREGTFELVSTINSALGNDSLPEERLRRLFDRSWPDLEKKFLTLREPSPAVQRSNEEVLSEVLETVRSIARRIPEQPLSNEPPRNWMALRALFVQKLSAAFPDLGPEEIRRVRAQFNKLGPNEFRKLVEGIRPASDGGYFLPESVLTAVVKARIDARPRAVPAEATTTPSNDQDHSVGDPDPSSQP
jgi:hypothetical protein